MTLSVMGGLVALALVDSTSVGTLGVPIWMLIQRRVRVAAVLLYLATIATFYWLLGLALLVGAEALADVIGGLEGNRTLRWAQLVVGAALLALSFRFDGERARARRAAQSSPGPGERWAGRVTGEGARLPTVIGVALLAGLVEAASMLPYLGAVALLTATDLSLVSRAGVLAGYVVVMALPALLLLAGRMLARRRVEPVLTRVNDVMQRHADGALGWVLGIIGFLLAADAVSSLGLIR